jgi:hypothetical protein
MRGERKAGNFSLKCLPAQEVKSPLALLVARIRANDPDHAFAPDDLALAADLLH